MPQSILDITKMYQKEDAVHVKVAAKELTVPLINQYYYEVKLKNTLMSGYLFILLYMFDLLLLFFKLVRVLIILIIIKTFINVVVVVCRQKLYYIRMYIYLHVAL